MTIATTTTTTTTTPCSDMSDTAAAAAADVRGSDSTSNVSENVNDKDNDKDKDNDDSQTSMTTEERLQWLRDRGVLVETPEERRAKEIKAIMNETDEEDYVVDTTNTESISFVMIPHDTSQPLQQMQFQAPTMASTTTTTNNDILMEHLKPIFQTLSRDKDVDIELLRNSTNAIHTLGSSSLTTTSTTDTHDATSSTKTATSLSPPMVSTQALQKVAAQGGVETFPLVHPTESNQYTGITIYLDEIGMLKRLPLNTRAIEYCALAGYNPPPQLYGTVFLARVVKKPYGTTGAMLQYKHFLLGVDTHKETAKWLQRAVMDNLEYQTQINQLTGRTNVTQPAVDGTDGTEKNEDGYTWTQTEEELELRVPVINVDDDNNNTTRTIASKDIKVKFMPQRIVIHHASSSSQSSSRIPLLQLELFERVDTDGCTWTLDRTDTNNSTIVVTMEKMEPALWPRIKD